MKDLVFLVPHATNASRQVFRALPGSNPHSKNVKSWWSVVLMSASPESVCLCPSTICVWWFPCARHLLAFQPPDLICHVSMDAVFPGPGHLWHLITRCPLVCLFTALNFYDFMLLSTNDFQILHNPMLFASLVSLVVSVVFVISKNSCSAVFMVLVRFVG